MAAKCRANNNSTRQSVPAKRPALLESLAQWAGATYETLIAGEEGAAPGKAHLLERLAELEYAVLTDPGEPA